MFSGIFTAKVDNHGRFTFPAKQLAQLGNSRNMYAMLGMHGINVWLMTKEYWEKLLENLLKENTVFGSTGMAVRRTFFGNSFDTEVENNSRIVLPSYLLEKVGIADKCTIVGVGEFFEIWEPDKFRENEVEGEILTNKAIKELGGPTKL